MKKETKYAKGGGVDEAKTYKINNTTAIEDEVNKFLHSLKLKDGYSNSMGTFTAKLTLEQFNKLVALIIGYDKNNNVYILDSSNNVVYDSKEARDKRKEMFKNYADGGGVGKFKTYKLRAEGLDDFLAFLRTGMYMKIKSFTVEPIGVPDVVVTFEIESSLSEIKSKLKEVQDSQVMLQTVKPINEYTGERDEEYAKGGGVGEKIFVVKDNKGKELKRTKSLNNASDFWSMNKSKNYSIYVIEGENKERKLLSDGGTVDGSLTNTWNYSIGGL